MSGLGSIYAIAEMNRCAEECSLKVRDELFRIGCSPNQISVIRQGSSLQMKHRQQTILVHPRGVLEVLKKSSTGTDSSTVWERISEHSNLLNIQSKKNCIGIAVVVGLIALFFFLALFLRLDMSNIWGSYGAA